MNEFHIGDVIRIRRTELGLSQEELAEGICEIGTLSRIENGVRTPSKSKLNALLQRLGLPGEKYFALVSQNDLDIENLQDEIASHNARNQFDESMKKLKELEKIVEKDDHITQQFILRTKIAIGKEENGFLRPYTYEESLDLLTQAIRLTVPRFEIDTIDRHLYTVNELKIINQIAVTHSKNGNIDTALDIYYQLIKYREKHPIHIKSVASVFSLIAYNYSRLLCIIKRPEAALKIASKGRNYCKLYGNQRCLPGLLVVMADCYHQINQDEKSKKYFLMSYYGYLAMENESNADIVKNHAKELLNIDIAE